MLLKSLYLKNIRSYLDEHIEFPLGSLLIEGDIGSGKSTILLAIDFALFGARPKELPASSLLRNGTNKGEVILGFMLDGKEIEIRRVLEKKGATITQTAGHININGTRKDLMSMGLKSVIFDILGYPKADIKAGKSLIYRYTVYTPQEQMKHIIMQKPDDRLNTIRTIFNIDKYRRISENAKSIIRELKRQSSRLDGIAYDLCEKQHKNEEIESLKKILGDELKKMETVHNKIAGNLEKKKDEKSEINSILKNQNKLMNDKKITETRLENEEKLLIAMKKEMTDLEEKLAAMKIDADHEQKITAIEKELEKKGPLLEEEAQITIDIKHIEQKITEAHTRKKSSLDLTKNILTLTECPTCMQEVSSTHKDTINQKETAKIENFNKILIIHQKTLDELKQKHKDLKVKIDTLHDSELIHLKLKNDLTSAKDIKDRISQKVQRSEILKTSIETLIKSIILLEKEIEPLKDTDVKAEKIEKELDILNGENTIALAQLEKTRQQITGIEKESETLAKEIMEKLKAKKESETLKETINWLKEYFVPLMETMEKHIMLSIQRDFDAMFREWFNILMDDDNLQARLDAQFTPVIDQNTYETAYDYLSGGEKTSIALAYRLALNKVINNMSENIKTKDLLILDEPTDGFSTEQLEKVRDVLSELNLKQTIIVSHEEIIESFVDKTLKVTKKGHVSHIA